MPHTAEFGPEALASLNGDGPRRVAAVERVAPAALGPAPRSRDLHEPLAGGGCPLQAKQDRSATVGVVVILRP